MKEKKEKDDTIFSMLHQRFVMVFYDVLFKKKKKNFPPTIIPMEIQFAFRSPILLFSPFFSSFNLIFSRSLRIQSSLPEHVHRTKSFIHCAQSEMYVCICMYEEKERYKETEHRISSLFTISLYYSSSIRNYTPRSRPTTSPKTHLAVTT